jgi:Domain of unknown function (DUF5134)
LDAFAAVMLAVAITSFGRLVVARRSSRPTHVDIDLLHLLMGVAMAGMFVDDLNWAPEGLWEVVFCVSAIWFMWRCYDFVARHGLGGHDEDHVHHISHFFTHVVMSLAMLDAYFATPAAATDSRAMWMVMGGRSATTADFLFLPLLFLFALSGSAIWELNDLDRLRRSGTPEQRIAAEVLVWVGTEGTVEIPAAIEAADGGAATTGRWIAPRLEAMAHIATCVAMGHMIVLMF